MRSMARCAFGWLLMAATAVVCFAQMAPSDSTDYAAKVITLTGQVSVLKDNQPWALNPGDSVQVRQIIISGPDGHASFQVSDGSTFEVFPNSTVVFRKNVPNWRDLLDVLVGRVRVHIQKLGNQPNPNRIYTPTAVISVRGTTFDVAVTDQDESTVVEVEEGEVAVQHALRPVGAPEDSPRRGLHHRLQELSAPGRRGRPRHDPQSRPARAHGRPEYGRISQQPRDPRNRRRWFRRRHPRRRGRSGRRH